MSRIISNNGPPSEESQETRTTDDRFRKLLRGRQLIVVSNRQPYRHDTDEDGDSVDRPTGGLTAGLDPVMQGVGGTWIAWGDGERDFDVADGDGCVQVPPEDPSYLLKRLRLSEDQVRGHYYGFSNQVLWPLCHLALTEIRCRPGFWRHYREVNEQFAAAVADRAGERPLVWFQDYQLALAPALVRGRLPEDAVLMQFWHVPWPSWDAFRACPHGRQLLEGLLGNDLLVVHTPRYERNFLRCVEAALDGASVDWQSGTVSYRGHATAVRSIPMGVPVDRIERSANSAGRSGWRSFTREHDIPADTRLAVGVDRLDYTKGIVERLRALERLWESRPRWRGELTLVQNSSESRSRIPAYREVQQDVSDAIERVNKRFGTDDWQPVVHLTEHLEREQLYALYRRADLAVVSPVRDGMNLVAQEYVAAQGEGGDGVLVLSDQAGLHDAVGEHTVSVRPHDTEGFADALAGALTMSPGERRQRLRQLRRWLAENDLESWLESNLRAAVATHRRAVGPGRPSPHPG